MQTIKAAVNYVAQMAEKPFVNVNDFSRNRLELETHEVVMRNAREITPSLWVEGFALVKQPLPAIDYNNPEAIIAEYLPAMQEAVVAATGADKVLMTDGPIIRHASATIEGAVRPAGFAHTDFTLASARRLLELSRDRLSGSESYDEAAQIIADSIDNPSGNEPFYRRIYEVQTWRVLTRPPHDYPLAICAASSVSAKDIIEAEFRADTSDFDEEGLEFSLYRPNPKHEWWWFPDMEPDEVLVFLGYDFRNHSGSRTLHTAFADPTAPNGLPGRSSAEARSYALFR